MKTCNILSLYRRHTSKCPIKNTPVLDTSNKKLKAACACPIVASGYLDGHRDANGKPLRIRHLSLGTDDWNQALIVQAELLKQKRLPDPAKEQPKSEAKVVTVEHAVKRYIESRGAAASAEPVAAATLSKDRVLLEKRLLPYCAENSITDVRHFENKDNCRQFIESWRQMRRNVGAPLDSDTKRINVQRFGTFLRFCMDAEWIGKLGSSGIKVKVKREPKRYGLEHHEYARVLSAAREGDPYTCAAMELMRWTGVRISDAQKFREAELVRNVSKTGVNADFEQAKTKRQCVVPVPDHVVERLRALKVDEQGYYFRHLSLTTLTERVRAVLKRAQQTKKFKHHVTPHCLRHTFAILNLNAGVDIRIVSKWLGHESVATTMKHYANAIESTKVNEEDIAQKAVERMLKASAEAA